MAENALSVASKEGHWVILQVNLLPTFFTLTIMLSNTLHRISTWLPSGCRSLRRLWSSTARVVMSLTGCTCLLSQHPSPSHTSFHKCVFCYKLNTWHIKLWRIQCHVIHILWFTVIVFRWCTVYWNLPLRSLMSLQLVCLPTCTRLWTISIRLVYLHTCSLLLCLQKRKGYIQNHKFLNVITHEAYAGTCNFESLTPQLRFHTAERERDDIPPPSHPPTHTHTHHTQTHTQ